MTTRTAACRCGQFTATGAVAFADPAFPPPKFSMYESRKHRWVDILGADVEHD